MLSSQVADSASTVLGPAPAEDLGLVLLREGLLSVMPGAELAPEIDFDPDRVYLSLERVLSEFRDLGGGTIVDRGGMWQGRDLPLYRMLSEETGVQIVASTGLGPQELVGSHFTNHPSKIMNPPWGAAVESVDHIADLFASEISEGAVVPPRERSGPAGIICVAASPDGLTEFEELLYRAAARAAIRTGAAVSTQTGKNPFEELMLLESEGLPSERIVIGDLDRLDTYERGDALRIAQQGAFVALDHAGWDSGSGYVNDEHRVRCTLELFEAGVGDRVIVASNAVGFSVGFGHSNLGFTHVLRKFVPLLHRAGGTDDHVQYLLFRNPQGILTLAAGEGDAPDEVE